MQRKQHPKQESDSPVAVGQRYEDTDKRYPGRVIEVIGFKDDQHTRAYVKTPSGRKVWIRVDRLQGKWYRLLGNKKEEGQ